VYRVKGKQTHQGSEQAMKYRIKLVDGTIIRTDNFGGASPETWWVPMRATVAGDEATIHLNMNQVLYIQEVEE
jgi:hypothetical protein